jgi:predicted regulator of amino acid metabolism with ACT domain
MPREWTVRGHRYEVIVSSSVEREGMAVEVWDAESPTAVELFEVFHHDPSGSRTMTVWTERELPVELISEALRLAEERFGGRPTDA